MILKKSALIFGDSYSTFEGYIPEGYDVYYFDGRSSTDVTRVQETWWHLLCREANLNLIHNNSWSGSTIGYTGYRGTDCSASSSFIYRLRKLAESGFFEENEIDTVFVFGGTNDSWSNAPLGEAKFSDWEEKDLFFVLPAIGYFLHALKALLPKAKIYCLINTEIKEEIISCLQEASKKYGITTVSFDTIDKTNGHPTVQGMKDIKNSVLKALSR